jgi:hypothetical protein
MGFINSRIRPGEIFDADEGFTAKWAEPVDAAKPKPDSKVDSPPQPPDKSGDGAGKPAGSKKKKQSKKKG